MNDKTLKCIILPPTLLSQQRVARGMSREIGGIHAKALCEKYGNNIAEAKQNSLSLHMKYTQDRASLQPPSSSPSYSSRRHRARGRVSRLLLSSPFLKHLICRDLEIRPITPTEYKCGFREGGGAILGELATKNRSARDERLRNVIYASPWLAWFPEISLFNSPPLVRRQFDRSFRYASEKFRLCNNRYVNRFFLICDDTRISGVEMHVRFKLSSIIY